MVNRVSVLHFDGRSTGAVARLIEKYTSDLELRVERRIVKGASTQALTDSDCVVLVFPVLGDGRMPDQVDDWIRSVECPPGNFLVCVLGDFLDDPALATEPLLWEINRHLSEKESRMLSPPLTLDTPVPVDEPEFGRSIEEWLQRSLAMTDQDNPHVGGADLRVNRGVRDHRPPAEPAIRKIAQLCGQMPYYRLNERGRCVSLSLQDDSPYPRSILREKGAPLGTLCSLLDELEDLERLAIRNAGLSRWPGNTAFAPRLKRLDLTGNLFDELDSLSECEKLEVLVLAANRLTTFPAPVLRLKRLQIVYMYKNGLNNIPNDIDRLEELRVLSMYRNRVGEVPAEVANLKHLTRLNLGANPLSNLPEEFSKLRKLRELNLDRGRFESLPKVCRQLPALRVLSLRRNPIQASREEALAWLGRPEVELRVD